MPITCRPFTPPTSSTCSISFKLLPFYSTAKLVTLLACPFNNKAGQAPNLHTAAGLSWSKTYETLSNAFTYVSDCTALDLKTDYVNDGLVSLGGTSQSLWQAVLQLWQDYRTWLTRVCSLCTRLMECVSAERAAEMMSRGKADTPTLFDLGKAAFRSQVCPTAIAPQHGYHMHCRSASRAVRPGYMRTISTAIEIFSCAGVNVSGMFLEICCTTHVLEHVLCLRSMHE